MAVITIPTQIGGVSIPGAPGSVLNGPLGALFGGKGVTTAKYPSDLATSQQQQNYVQFSIKEVVPAGYAKDTTNLQKGTNIGGIGQAGVSAVTSGAAAVGNVIANNPITNFVASVIPNVVTKFIGNAADYAADTAIGKAALKEINDATNFLSGVAANGLKISPQTTQSKAYISLYMPDTLTASYNAQYDEVSLTASGLQDLNMIGQAYKNGKDTVLSGGSLVDVLSTDPGVTYLATKYKAGLINRLGMDAHSVQSLLLKGQGYAINPQLQMIYKGADLRTFSLTFMFSPRNKIESDAVSNILYLFKRSWAPSLQAAGEASTQSMFLIAPDIFNIKFNVGANVNPYLPQYGDCVLTNIDINYAPNGFAAYNDGSPVQTTLTLQFKEIEMVTRDRLDAGFSGKQYSSGRQDNSQNNPGATSGTNSDGTPTGSINGIIEGMR